MNRRGYKHGDKRDNREIEIFVDGLDGTKIGEFKVAPTGGWENWQTINAVLDHVSSTMDGLWR